MSLKKSAVGPIREGLFDDSLIKKTYNNDHEFIKKVIASFLQRITRNKIDEIAAAAKEGDVELLTLRAHSLKDAAATVGAIERSKIACEIERASEAGDLQSARSLLPELEHTFIATIESISRLYPPDES